MKLKRLLDINFIMEQDAGFRGIIEGWDFLSKNFDLGFFDHDEINRFKGVIDGNSE